MVLGVEGELSKMPIYSEELGLDLSKPGDRFKYFLASLLFAKRISTEIAKKTFRRFVDETLITPDAIIRAGWDRLVEVLDSGGYVRYDFSTATNLLETTKKLRDEYGNLEELHERAADPRDLEKRLEEFRGFGPIGVNIFLRELRGIWPKAKPKPSQISVAVARSLNLAEVEEYESALVRLRLEYCKKKRCRECPVREYCKTRKYEVNTSSANPSYYLTVRQCTTLEFSLLQI
jgi:endonuclease III